MQNYTQCTDDQLVRAFVSGDNTAFDNLLYRYQDRVLSYILRLVKDEDVANDLFQETFVKAIMTIKQGRYQSDGKFGAWITRIAHNHIIDHFRQEKALATISADNEDVDVLNRKELSEGTIEDMLIYNQTLSDVRRLVEMLPKEQRQVLMMRYYDNMSFKEIAELTGVSINTALGRMRYALINMRKQVADAGVQSLI
ncbi:MAG: RNA polymerase sigma factor [Muribaculaceae bacterium]